MVVERFGHTKTGVMINEEPRRKSTDASLGLYF